MNFANKIYKKFAGAILLCALCFAGIVSQSCTEEIDQSNRYTFTGETIVDYLENRSDSFTDFLSILNRATVGRGGNIKHLMATYGRYTCLAPTDSALRLYVRETWENYVKDSIAVDNGEMDAADLRHPGIYSPYFEDLTDEKCTEIALNHIIEGEAYHTYDLAEGAFGRPNMNDRYITYRFVADEVTGVVSLKLNDASTCIVSDFDVENGVVHVLDRVLNPSNALGPDLLKSYEEYFSIFSEVLFKTEIDKRIRQTSYDMEKTGIAYGELKKREFQPNNNWDGRAKTPETHYIKYTILAIPDVVFHEYGIYTSDDLLILAKKWYGDKYVEGETPITSPNHPLYRFIAYHIVDRQLQLSGGFVQDNIKFTDGFDSEIKNGTDKGFNLYEYYETLLDNGKLLKCTKPYTPAQDPQGRNLTGSIVLNYGQNNGATFKNEEMQKHLNVRVLPVADFKKMVGGEFEFKQEALNAMLHPIDRILIYNTDEMQGNVLNERMRINFMAFFPELTNNNIRWAYAEVTNEWFHYYIPPGYCERIKFRANGSSMYYLRSHVGSTEGWCDYQGDEIITSGPYDFEYRIPHVPAGTYELRLGTCLYTSRGIAQTYLDGKVTGIPIDLRTESASELVKERYAFKLDDGNELQGDPDLIDADDKARRNRGYMKGPASSFVGSDGSKSLREARNAARIILGTFTLTEGDHWIRFKNTKEDNTTEFMHNYLEIVPRGVISDPSKPEDKF